MIKKNKIFSIVIIPQKTQICLLKITKFKFFYVDFVDKHVDFGTYFVHTSFNVNVHNNVHVYARSVIDTNAHLLIINTKLAL